MIFAGGQNLAGRIALCGAVFLALAGAAFLSGCKGNTRAAGVERRTGKPPVVAARLMSASADGERNDPLSSKMWREAEWWPLVAPANTARTTPASRATVLYDAGTLYVAVINDVPEWGTEEQDTVSLYIDTHGDGKEVLQVTTDARGGARAAWIRASTPVGPQEDGGPNIGYPLDIRPDIQVRGMTARVGRGLADGREAWTVVLALPVTGMPPLMQALPAPGAHWRFNVLRSVMRRGEQYQGNLSPVYVNAQAASAYRMAELEFVGMTNGE